MTRSYVKHDKRFWKNHNRLANLNTLLEDSPEAYYWLGFLMADGSFKKEGRLALTLAIQDQLHLEKFATFIEYKKSVTTFRCGPGRRYRACKICVMHTEPLKVLVHKFSISADKTRHPCDLTAVPNDELLFCLMIGFIDGDGCMRYATGRKHPALIIKCHSSWLTILTLFSELIKRMYTLSTAGSRLNNQGYAHLTITDTAVLKTIKRRAVRLKLPLLERKWCKVDINFISRHERSRRNTILVSKLIKRGKTNKEIAARLSISLSSVTRIAKSLGYKWRRSGT